MTQPHPDLPASPWARHFVLDPEVVFLNHGSFGACPRPILEAQAEWRARLEREPVLFLGRQLEGCLDHARAALAAFVRCDPDDLAFVPNATTGVNTVLRSLRLAPGDELLVTDHEYNACRNALDYVAERSGAQVVVAAVPFPLRDPLEAVQAILARARPRTRLLLVDHVTSQTGMVLPVEKIVRAMAERGIDTLVDGAHAPGMLELDLRAIGAAYYTGNLHKWVCTPKGSALLYVRRDRQAGIRPLCISHGANSKRTDRTRFRLEFDFTGTLDPSPWLVVPDALHFMGSLLPGGWPALRAHNRELALAARAVLCAALGVRPPVPDVMIGSLVSLPLPDQRGGPPRDPHYADALQERLFEEHRIEVPVMLWPAPPRRVLRIAAQVYNTLPQYERLARVLPELLAF